jgi:hypothetical protein
MPLGIFRCGRCAGRTSSACSSACRCSRCSSSSRCTSSRCWASARWRPGLAYLPLSIFIILSAGAASQLVTRLGFKPPLTAGLILIAIGLLWFSRVDPGGSYVGDVLFPSLIVAVGLGFSFVPVTIAAVTGTSPAEAGLASGLINTSQQIGGALGVAILASVANSVTNGSTLADPGAALTEGFQSAFLVGRGLRRAGRDPHAGAHLEQGLARDGGQGQGRRGPGRRRRLTWPDCGPRLLARGPEPAAGRGALGLALGGVGVQMSLRARAWSTVIGVACSAMRSIGHALGQVGLELVEPAGLLQPLAQDLRGGVLRAAASCRASSRSPSEGSSASPRRWRR